jgi:hypothetical protein
MAQWIVPGYGQFGEGSDGEWILPGHGQIQDTSGAVAYSLDCAAGSYTITGTAAALEHDRVLVAAAGSYAITGTALTMDRTYVLAAEAGAYIISGVAASLEEGGGAPGGSMMLGPEMTLRLG